MKCKRCKVVKTLLETGRCEGCEQYCKSYYEKHRDQEIARAQKSNRSKSREEHNTYKKAHHREKPLVIMIRNAKSRAKEKNLPFDLSVDDLEIPTMCPVLGIPLCVNEKHVGANSPSLDRLIPELGYVKSNVTVISHKANTIKNNASIEELEKILAWMKER